MPKSKLILSFFVGCISMMIAANLGRAQDTTWQQVLAGWVNDVYYENLFLGGSYITRISLADIDNDGDLDMFYGGGDCGSLVYFENIGTPSNFLFELGYEEFPGLITDDFGGIVDVDFADLDYDGDLDVGYSADLDVGGNLNWNDGSPENPYFVYRYPLGPLQGQSNPTLIDIDNDGDYDFFSGYGYRDKQMYFAENIGTAEEPNFVHRTYNYQGLNFGIPFNFDFGDIDEDGDYDLLVCKQGGNVAYYGNIGTQDTAVFSLITNDFLSDRDTTDWMETPELADIDNDGDLDLFLAGAKAHLYFFENMGSNAQPQFVERSDTSYFYVIPHVGGTWLNNSVDIDGDGDDDLGPGTSLFLNESVNGEIRYSRVDNALPFVAGTLVDLDADGDYDYVVPAGNYTVGYYENIGDVYWPVWNSRVNLFPPDSIIYYVFSVTAGDLDGDGDNDLVVGHGNCDRPTFYRNIGTPEVYEFEYGGLLSLPFWESHGAWEALLEDIEGDGDLDLLIGDIRSSYHPLLRLMFYRNDGTPNSPLWTYVTDDFLGIEENHRNGSLGPCLSDVDKDGDKDLIFSAHWGFMLFLNPAFHTGIGNNPETVNTPNSPFIIHCYPNPFNSAVTISVGNAGADGMVVEIYDILGRFRESLKISDSRAIWEASGYSSGVYFARVKMSENTAVEKLLYLK